jgi:hypothetical protein
LEYTGAISILTRRTNCFFLLVTNKLGVLHREMNLKEKVLKLKTLAQIQCKKAQQRSAHVVVWLAYRPQRLI